MYLQTRWCDIIIAQELASSWGNQGAKVEQTSLFAPSQYKAMSMFKNSMPNSQWFKTMFNFKTINMNRWLKGSHVERPERVIWQLSSVIPSNCNFLVISDLLFNCCEVWLQRSIANPENRGKIWASKCKNKLCWVNQTCFHKKWRKSKFWYDSDL